VKDEEELAFFLNSNKNRRVIHVIERSNASSLYHFIMKNTLFLMLSRRYDIQIIDLD